MNNTAPDSETRIELYVQSLSPHGARAQQDEVVERLLDLAETESVDVFDLHVWGKQLCPNAAAVRTDAGNRYAERREQFREWSGHDGRRADHLLDAHEVDAGVAGDCYTAVPTPVLLLAEFEGEELTHVAPCHRGDSMTTVRERIRTLERGIETVDAGKNADASRPSEVRR